MILKDFLNINLSIYTIPEIYLFSITLSKVKANITQDPTFLMEMKTFTSGHVVLENKDVLINLRIVLSSNQFNTNFGLKNRSRPHTS